MARRLPPRQDPRWPIWIADYRGCYEDLTRSYARLYGSLSTHTAQYLLASRVLALLNHVGELERLLGISPSLRQEILGEEMTEKENWPPLEERDANPVFFIRTDLPPARIGILRLRSCDRFRISPIAAREYRRLRKILQRTKSRRKRADYSLRIEDMRDALSGMTIGDWFRVEQRQPPRPATLVEIRNSFTVMPGTEPKPRGGLRTIEFKSAAVVSTGREQAA